jgi:hypothetical protein
LLTLFSKKTAIVQNSSATHCHKGINRNTNPPCASIWIYITSIIKPNPITQASGPHFYHYLEVVSEHFNHYLDIPFFIVNDSYLGLCLFTFCLGFQLWYNSPQYLPGGIEIIILNLVADLPQGFI